MSQWTERILREFPADLNRLWIASDPDGVLLDEQILSSLRERGFEVLPFGDSVVFRAEFEERYRSAWDLDEDGPAKSLVVHLRSTNLSCLPWDLLRQARCVSLSLADLFPKLSYGVVRQIGAEYLEQLFDAQYKHAPQALGETATKEFVLTHIFHFHPHLISTFGDIWRELLRLRNRDAVLPQVLADHVARVLCENDAFRTLPIRDLFVSKGVLLHIIQNAWFRYLCQKGVTGTSSANSARMQSTLEIDVPFDHPDIRVIIESMFLDGTLHPMVAQDIPTSLPEWMKIGITPNPDGERERVLEGISSLTESLPPQDSSHREWAQLSRKFGELLARFYLLDSVRAESAKKQLQDLQDSIDTQLHQWVIGHYSDLPSLPAMKGPVMVHHIPRYLATRRGSGEQKIALLVFDGMALDQWTLIRECLTKQCPNMVFDEGACFAWIPTITSVSRQALFSGLKPREYAPSIDTTAADSSHWSRFWQDNKLRPHEVYFRKGIVRADQLNDLDVAFGNPSIKVVGIVIETVDDFVHGAVLGKRGIATQIEDWCETGFVGKLLTTLLDKSFYVYITADHGNLDAVGQGRPNEGVAPEQCGERVRIYNSQPLADTLCSTNSNVFRLNIPALPVNYLPVFASGQTAFVHKGEQLVAHGGISVQELIVPFVKVSVVR